LSDGEIGQKQGGWVEIFIFSALSEGCSPVPGNKIKEEWIKLFEVSELTITFAVRILKGK
jgi:hypothetical protein